MSRRPRSYDDRRRRLPRQRCTPRTKARVGRAGYPYYPGHFHRWNFHRQPVPIPPGDLSIKADRVYKAVYGSRPSQGGGYNYRIELLDTKFTSGEEFRRASGTGNHVVLDLWGTASADPAGPALPKGKYYMDCSSTPGTCHGQYSYVEHFDRNGNLVPLNFWNATVDVVREGSGYRLDFSGEDNRNEKITCSYSGPITFTVQNAAPVYGGQKSIRHPGITEYRKVPETPFLGPGNGIGKRLSLKRSVLR